MKNLLCWTLALLLFAILVGCGKHPSTEPANPGTGTIQVTVVQNSAPVAGAMCQLDDSNGTAVGQAQSTDANGQATLKNVPVAQGYKVEAEKAGATGVSEGIRVSGGQDPVLVTVEIKLGTSPTAIVTGKVTDAITGAPIFGAHASAGAAKADSGADGAYELDQIAAGAVTLQVGANGYAAASKDLVLKAGSSQTIDVALEPTSYGPRAGHTIVTTSRRVLEVDTWHDPLLSVPTSQAWSATYVPGNGSILVADASRWGGIVTEFSPTGAQLASLDGAKLGLFGHVKGVHGATRTKLDTTVIADTGNNRVVELDENNHKVWEYKTNLKSPSWAQRLDNGDTVIVDTGNNRVIEVSQSGDIVFGIGDGSANVLSHPTSAQYLASTDTFLVTDAGNNRVMEVDRQNHLVWAAGGATFKLDDQSTLNNPGSARRLPGGTTLIADTGNDRVVEVDLKGSVVWKLPVTAPVFADRI